MFSSPFSSRSLVRSAILSSILLFLGASLGTAQTSATIYNFSHLAGPAGTATSVDGRGNEARFVRPLGVVADVVGTAYVLDSGSSVIRKVTVNGTVTTLAGSPGLTGNADGSGSSARFSHPGGVAIDSLGNLYIADTDNNTVRKITSSGTVTTLAGSSSGEVGTANGQGATARFYRPSGIAVDRQGNIYVADTFNHAIRKISASGTVTTLAGTAGSEGAADGTGAAARFSRPTGIAVNDAGDVFVTDSGNHTVRRINSTGLVSTLAGSPGLAGTADGAGATARFSEPTGIAVGPNGVLFVADNGGTIIRQISSTGVVSPYAGNSGTIGSTDGSAATARFSGVNGLGFGGVNTLYVADTNNNTIRTLSSAAVTATLAGSPPTTSVDGTGSAARFNFPSSVAVDGSGTVYVADKFNHTIRKITTSGAASTFVGTVGRPGSADGTGINAQFFQPSSLVIDRSGTLYVADTGNNTIRRVSPSGNVTTFAGSPEVRGSANNFGTAASFDHPQGIAIDTAGNLYVADQFNHLIRKITTAGSVSTLAGSAGLFGSQNGTGSAARFFLPESVAVDSIGNVYVSDRNHVIRKITPNGVVTTLAGATGEAGSADGTGASARFNQPAGLRVDANGNIFVADANNNTIRMINGSGVVVTVGGKAGEIGSADGLTGTATLNHPSDVAIDANGNLYVADTDNGAIRKGTVPAPTLPIISAQPSAQAAITGGRAVFIVTATNAVSYQWLKDGVAIPGATSASLVLTSVQASDAGNYQVVITGTAGEVKSVSVPLTVTPQSGVRLINISTRSYVGSGADVMIAGFIIGGTENKTVLLRATGPSLAQFNLPGLLADPVLELYRQQTIIASNDNWGDDPVAKAILNHAFLLTNSFVWPDGSKDAALVATLSPGGYTAVVRGQNNTTGLALVEAYEVDLANGNSKLINLSTRSVVRTSPEVQIAGFIIGGTGSKKVLIRASGPALTKYGVPAVLADPVLEVHDANTTIATNDDWQAANRADFQTVGVDNWDLGSKDAAVVLTLNPGAYTAIVSGKDSTPGVSLIELFEME